MTHPLHFTLADQKLAVDGDTIDLPWSVACQILHTQALSVLLKSGVKMSEAYELLKGDQFSQVLQDVFDKLLAEPVKKGHLKVSHGYQGRFARYVTITSILPPNDQRSDACV